MPIEPEAKRSYAAAETFTLAGRRSLNVGRLTVVLRIGERPGEISDKHDRAKAGEQPVASQQLAIIDLPGTA